MKKKTFYPYIYLIRLFFLYLPILALAIFYWIDTHELFIPIFVGLFILFFILWCLFQIFCGRIQIARDRITLNLCGFYMGCKGKNRWKKDLCFSFQYIEKISIVDETSAVLRIPYKKMTITLINGKSFSFSLRGYDGKSIGFIVEKYFEEYKKSDYQK
mgnify:FL=1